MMVAAKTRNLAWFYHDSVAKFLFWSGFGHRVQTMFFLVFPRPSWLAGFDLNRSLYRGWTKHTLMYEVSDVVLHPIPPSLGFFQKPVLVHTNVVTQHEIVFILSTSHLPVASRMSAETSRLSRLWWGRDGGRSLLFRMYGMHVLDATRCHNHSDFGFRIWNWPWVNTQLMEVLLVSWTEIVQHMLNDLRFMSLKLIWEMFELSKKGLWTSHFLKPGEVWKRMQRPGSVNCCQPKGICRPHYQGNHQVSRRSGKFCMQMFSIWGFFGMWIGLGDDCKCCIMLIDLFCILLAAFLLFHHLSSRNAAASVGASSPLVKSSRLNGLAAWQKATSATLPGYPGCQTWIQKRNKKYSKHQHNSKSHKSHQHKATWVS